MKFLHRLIVLVASFSCWRVTGNTETESVESTAQAHNLIDSTALPSSDMKKLSRLELRLEKSRVLLKAVFP